MKDKLIDLALQQRWDLVDELVPVASKEEEVITWAATEGIGDDEPELRDLAASLIENTPLPLSGFEGLEENLYSLLDHYPPFYDGFRAACAIINQGMKYRGDAISTLEKAKENPEEEEDVRKIARDYLANLTN